MEDKLTEFEQKYCDMIHKRFNNLSLGKWPSTDEIVSDLRQIMPPTCTPNERKFLDEINMLGEFIESLDMDTEDGIYFGHSSSFLSQSDFDANLSELVEKKKNE